MKMVEKSSLYLHICARIRFVQLCFQPGNGRTVVSVQVAGHLQGQLLRAGARDSAKRQATGLRRGLSTQSIEHSNHHNINHHNIKTYSSIAAKASKMSITAHGAACKRTMVLTVTTLSA
jgi:hypothetical protein